MLMMKLHKMTAMIVTVSVRDEPLLLSDYGVVE